MSDCCTLERFVRERWQAGETDLDELTCSGLSFLSRLQVVPEHRGEDALPTPHISAACCEAQLAARSNLAALSFCIAASFIER